MFSTGEPVEEWQMANLDWLAGEVQFSIHATVDPGVHRVTDPANCALPGHSTIIFLWQAIFHMR